MGTRSGWSTCSLIALFALDIGTDLATGTELILNDHYSLGQAVLFVVLVPSIVAILAEIYRIIVFRGCCNENSSSNQGEDDDDYVTDWSSLIFYPMYTILMLVISGCYPRFSHEAHYLRCIEGFLQASIQLVLQLSIVAKGVLVHSLGQLVHQIQHEGLQWEFFKDKDARWYWGLIQVYSLILSFLSLLQTCVHFNEWPKRRHTIHRMLLVLPFFIATILYRLLAITLLIVFAGKLALIPIGILAITHIITMATLGLDLPRSIVYGLCSILAPVGYGRCRDPYNQPLGQSLYMSHNLSSRLSPGHGDRSPEEVEFLRERSRNALAMHIIIGGGLLGISVSILGLLINFTQVFEPLNNFTFMTKTELNDLAFPGVAGSYFLAVGLTAVFIVCIGRCFEEEYVYPI